MSESIFEHARMIVIRVSIGLPKNAYDQNHDLRGTMMWPTNLVRRRRATNVEAEPLLNFWRVQRGEYGEVYGSKSGQEFVGRMALTAAIQPKPKGFRSFSITCLNDLLRESPASCAPLVGDDDYG
jgi:hypothetical protein